MQARNPCELFCVQEGGWPRQVTRSALFSQSLRREFSNVSGRSGYACETPTQGQKGALNGAPGTPPNPQTDNWLTRS